MEIFGVRDKQDVIGVNLFENPNVSAQLAARIQTEDMVDFRLNYDFDRPEMCIRDRHNEQFRNELTGYENSQVNVSVMLKKNSGYKNLYLCLLYTSTLP